VALEGSLEENVLALICFSKDHAHNVALEVDTDLFSTRAYKIIAVRAVEYLTNYNSPAGTHLRDILESEIKRGDEGKLISATIQAMEELYPQMNTQFIMDQLAHFVRKSKMMQVALNYADLVHKGKLDEAEAVMEHQEANSAFTEGVWAHDDKAMTAFMDEREEDLFSSGIEEFDKRGLRPARGTMFLMIAQAKAGKSWMLINAAKQCLLDGHSVLHISLENSEKLTAKRYIQALYAMTKDDAGAIRIPRFIKNDAGQLTDIVFNDLHTPKSVTPANRRFIQAKLRALKNKPRLLIKRFPMGSLTMSALSAYMEMLDRKFNFRPDAVVFDYPDLMAIKGDKREALGVVFQQLCGLSVRRDFALLTVTQSSKLGAQAKIMTQEHVAEDWSKIATSDVIVTYNQTRQEKKLGLARLFVAAARDATDGYVVTISQSYKTGQFCIDSAYHSAGDEALIEHMTGEPTGRGQEVD
jgi:hypothetical protein